MNLLKPDPVPGPPLEPVPQLPAGPFCERCHQPALVQWRRRLTQAELDVEHARLNEIRAERILLQDPENPLVFGPLPSLADSTMAVFACGQHAIDINAAALIHQADCTGPHGDQAPHPQCSCTPEPHPQPEPAPEPELPAHWT